MFFFTSPLALGSALAVCTHARQTGLPERARAYSRCHSTRAHAAFLCASALTLPSLRGAHSCAAACACFCCAVAGQPRQHDELYRQLPGEYSRPASAPSTQRCSSTLCVQAWVKTLSPTFQSLVLKFAPVLSILVINATLISILDVTTRLEKVTLQRAQPNACACACAHACVFMRVRVMCACVRVRVRVCVRVCVCVNACVRAAHDVLGHVFVDPAQIILLPAAQHAGAYAFPKPRRRCRCGGTSIPGNAAVSHSAAGMDLYRSVRPFASLPARCAAAAALLTPTFVCADPTLSSPSSAARAHPRACERCRGRADPPGVCLHVCRRADEDTRVRRCHVDHRPRLHGAKSRYYAHAATAALAWRHGALGGTYGVLSAGLGVLRWCTGKLRGVLRALHHPIQPRIHGVLPAVLCSQSPPVRSTPPVYSAAQILAAAPSPPRRQSAEHAHPWPAWRSYQIMHIPERLVTLLLWLIDAVCNNTYVLRYVIPSDRPRLGPPAALHVRYCAGFSAPQLLGSESRSLRVVRPLPLAIA